MKRAVVVVLLALAAGATAWKMGVLPGALTGSGTAAKEEQPATAPVPAVSVVPAKASSFVETVLLTGSLIARDEILVSPEVEGLKVLKLNADEGDRVSKGDVLAVLVSESLDAQIAQSDASLARSSAAIAQARSQITDAESRVAEAGASLERARPLLQSKYLSESVYDQRLAAAKSARAQLAVANDGLRLAEAEKKQAEAQRRELDWKRGNTEVRAPESGIVSRRGARIGSIAVGSFVAGTAEPMFRIIARGEIELDAEVPEARLAKLAVGQPAQVEMSGGVTATGTVRLVSPEVDKSTRLGRVRIFFGDNPALKTGAFARATVETAKSEGLGIPQSAVLYGTDGATVLVVESGVARTRAIRTGLVARGLVQVTEGLKAGDLVIAKAGTFLRDGDAVRPVEPGTAVSEVQ